MIYYIFILIIIIITVTILILKKRNIEKNEQWKLFLNNKKLLLDRKYYKGYYNIFMRNVANLNSHPVFVSIFKDFPINKTDEFLDIGSGLGLMCFGIKQNLCFKNIYGVELNKKSYDISIENLNTFKNYDNIDFINKSIFNYRIPNTVSYIYCFNPFKQNIQLLEKILLKCKKLNKITIVWMNLQITDKYKSLFEKYNYNFISKKLIYPYVILKNY